jgi:hypothetical protein
LAPIHPPLVASSVLQIERRVSPAMNQALLADYTDEEITSALHGIGDLKAPDPDGMPAIFFQKILGPCG